MVEFYRAIRRATWRHRVVLIILSPAVAALAGLARIEGPWRELVAFYRQASTMRVSYELVMRAVTRDPPTPADFERR